MVGARLLTGTTVCLLAVVATAGDPLLVALAVCVLASSTTAATLQWEQRRTQIALVEALVAGLLVGVSAAQFSDAVAYCLVPPFVAGLAGRWAPIAVAIGIQFVCINLLTLPELTASSLQGRLELSLPWLIISFGVAALGHFLTRSPEAPSVGGDDTGYESARHLLAQLRTVARRLSAGLDPVGIAQQMLAEVDTRNEVALAVVLARSEGGSLQPLAEQGDGAARELTADDPIVMDAWTDESAVQRPSGAAGSPRYIRLALPLQVGVRVIGVLVAETSRSLSGDELTALRQALSEHCVRLDTAMLFDEVRSLATAEERRRLAREIHDGIAQEIASLGYLVDGMVADPAGASRDDLQQLRSELTRLTNELRLSIFDLRTEVSPTASLGAVLSDHVRLIGSRSGMTVHLSLAEGTKRLPVQTETEILRIAQEAITNARKHSGGRNLHVSLAVEAPHARLVVADDGRGLAIARDDSFGMRTMRERADRVGATLRVRDKVSGSSGVEVILILEDRRKQPRLSTQHSFDYIA
ncbi:MAG: hypothetical protein H0V32_08375 [Nocardioidaceae bacterium]|nr:hypothetical protein [Nocardioidaceae bacterium]MDQ3324132.1 histidine kinase [Actinomycetota bacterium]